MERRLRSESAEMVFSTTWFALSWETLIRVGRGFYEPEKVKEILEAKDRKAAGVTAPPHGLILAEIRYE